MKQHKEWSASEITRKAIEILESRNIFCWRQANMTYGKRKGVATPGVPDIIGYNKTTGLAVFAEVKKNGDTLKPAQIAFLTRAKAAGVVTLIAKQVGDKVELIEFLND